MEKYNSFTVVFSCPVGSRLQRRLINRYKEKIEFEGAKIIAISLKDELTPKTELNRGHKSC